MRADDSQLEALAARAATQSQTASCREVIERLVSPAHWSEVHLADG
jgi:hypothetical protein